MADRTIFETRAPQLEPTFSNEFGDNQAGDHLQSLLPDISNFTDEFFTSLDTALNFEELPDLLSSSTVEPTTAVCFPSYTEESAAIYMSLSDETSTTDILPQENPRTEDQFVSDVLHFTPESFQQNSPPAYTEEEEYVTLYVSEEAATTTTAVPDWEMMSVTSSCSPEPDHTDFAGVPEDLPTMLTAFEMTPSQPNMTKKHKKGPKPLPLEELPVENLANVVRCREYRARKTNQKNADEMEVKRLSIKNTQLRKKMKERQMLVNKMQTLYLKLITDKKIRFYDTA